MTEQAMLRRAIAAGDIATLGASKMWSVHLLDIEALAHGPRPHAALRAAVQIPHVCVALSDEQLRSSYQRYQTWCDQWLEPVRIDDDVVSIPFAELYASYEHLCGADGLSPLNVPVKALKELQLKRLVRAAASRTRAEPPLLDHSELRSRRAALFLSNAAWRWYMEFASVNTTVQSNLARLAVIR